MTPTNKLRWKKVRQKDRPYADLTLQQWWADFAIDASTNQLVERNNGEWRDVPVEIVENV
jgi:hypothetical protein